MEKYIFGGICIVSALVGIGLGYLVVGPVQASAMANRDAHVNAYATYEIEPTADFAPEQAQDYLAAHEETDDESTHRYLVTAIDGYIVIYDMTPEDKSGGQSREITSTTIDSLSPEEQARLLGGIRIYSEEALVRILEDYGS